MVSLKSLTLASALTLGNALLAPAFSAAQAADLSLPFVGSASPVNAEQPIEWGSGWYLRGDLAYNKDTQPPLNADMSYSNSKPTMNTTSLDLGFGLKLNNWMRADTTFEFGKGLNANGNTAAKNCQIGAAAITNALGTIIGSTPINSSCYGAQHASLNHWNLMANGYLDLGTWSGLTPYIGAGVGITHQVASGDIKYFYSGTQNSYKATWTDPYTSATYTNFWDMNYKPKAHTQFAWSLMGGIAIDVSEHTKIDIGGTYLNMGSLTFVDSVTGNTIKKTMTSKSIKVGLRYMID